MLDGTAGAKDLTSFERDLRVGLTRGRGRYAAAFSRVKGVFSPSPVPRLRDTRVRGLYAGAVWTFRDDIAVMDMDGSGWKKAFFDGRLEEAYGEATRDAKGLLRDVMQARIASLLLRPAVAHAHFLSCLAYAKRATQSAESVARLLILLAYAVEHELLYLGPRPRLLTIGSDIILPPGEIVVRASRQLEGARTRVLVALRRNAEAVTAYTRLITVERKEKAAPNVLATWHQGRACALAGLERDPEEDLEAAGMHCVTCEHRLHQARIAGLLATSWAYLEDERRTASWSQYLTNLRCPPETERAIRVRGLVMLARCAQTRQLVAL